MPKPLLKWLVGTLLSVSTNYSHYNITKIKGRDKMSDKRKIVKASYGKKLLSAAAVVFFSVFTVAFFGPMEIFLGNIIEFKFSAQTAALILAITSAAASAVVSLLISLLPAKILKHVNMFIFSGGLCVYLQNVMLNGKMGSLTGEIDVYSKGLIIGNLAVWLAVFVIVFAVWLIMQRLKKSKYVFSGMRFAAIALIAMQLVGFFSLYLNIDSGLGTLKDQYLTDSGKFELSQNENVVYFVIDTFDGAVTEQMLEKYPDAFDGFGDFTYFPNMTTTHSRTFPSLTYLLTGEMCYFDKPYPQYVNEAFKKSEFLEDIDALGADIRIFTEPQYLGQSDTHLIDNHVSYDSSSLDAMNLKDFLKKSIKVSAYRGAPYLAKGRFKYTSAEVNTASMKELEGKASLLDDPVFFQEVLFSDFGPNKDYDKTFRFYHLNGTHPGAVLGAYGEADPNADYADNARGSLYTVEKCMEKMREAGIYKDSTIIITADHGYSGGGETLDLPYATSCIMLVKPAGADGSKAMKTSMAPVCHEDLFATVIEGLGGDSEKYGRTICEIGENEERARKYYYTALYSDVDGEVALREYSVKGDARLLESYTPTGKYWDVNYSERAVSKRRFED